MEKLNNLLSALNQLVDKLLTSLDTPGGHLLFFYFLIITGAVFSKFNIPKSEDILVFALGAMSRGMGITNGK